MLDIRKAPSLPRLLMMRGLFNQYKKLQTRAAQAAQAPQPQTEKAQAAPGSTQEAP